MTAEPAEVIRVDKQRIHTNPQHYSWLTEQLSPPSPLGSGLFQAFWVGGLICAVGQGISDIGVHLLDLTARDASTLASMSLIFLTALLTGISIRSVISPFSPALM